MLFLLLLILDLCNITICNEHYIYLAIYLCISCLLSLQLNTQLSGLTSRVNYSDSEPEDMDEDPAELADPMEIPTPPILSSDTQPPLSKGKTTIIGGKKIASKTSARSKHVPVDTDVGALIGSLQTQEQRSDALHGQISGLLSREQTPSATSVWGSFMGALAAEIDPRLLPRFYRTTLDTVLGFVEESRQLNTPVIPVQPLTTVTISAPMTIPAPTFGIQHDQQQGTFTAMLPPPQQSHSQLQQDSQQSVAQPFYHPLTGRPGPAWDSVAPSAGQNIPQRPASTPTNLGSSLHLSGLSDLVGFTPPPVTPASYTFVPGPSDIEQSRDVQ